MFYLYYHSKNKKKKAAAQALVEGSLSKNKVVIFSKTTCPHSQRAKELFKSDFPDVPVKIFELDRMEQGSAIKSYLKEKTGETTTPNIFINGQYIGGADKVVELHSQGKLAQLIEPSDRVDV